MCYEATGVVRDKTRVIDSSLGILPNFACMEFSLYYFTLILLLSSRRLLPVEQLVSLHPVM